MPGQFWNSWVLWEKMCFCLGCGIFATIILGCLKLVYTHWRLRKYTAIATKKQEERQQREMNHTESIKRRKDQEIPFGIRAIESGIEVDGVWISRPNTPTRSSPEITSFSSIQEPMSSDNLHPPCRSSSTYSIPRLELPQPVHGYSDATQSRSRIASGAPGSHHERGVSAERWPNRDISPGSDYTRGSRPTYEPRRSSHLRYSNPHLLSDPTTLDALEGRELRTNFSSQSSEGTDEDHPNYNSSDSSEEASNTPSHYIPQRPHQSRFRSSAAGFEAVHLSPVDARPFTERGRADLESLANHRRSHAAETGQLFPRVRYIGVSGDWTQSASSSIHRTDPNDGMINHAPWPLNETVNPFTTPLDTPLLEPTHTEAPSFQSFLDSAPVNVRRQSVPLLDEVEEVVPQASPQDSPQALQDADANCQLRRPSQVIRKVNSGFEILQPGTFASCRQSSDITDGRQDFETGDRRQSKRLQKKRRGESISARDSAFTEQVS